ncbi:hypothetical protein RchiOBHm_Chr3g0474711 [Rosa chinensis]|uniref:Uncharacterized protein n=1 Tax=Rosa chinensis TaxID=74649 RepID=A0A2P6RC68_ROSCH|nr:hypothetical protein RchiOBHm_Chr3g0474711 [Rosa chinensis]
MSIQSLGFGFFRSKPLSISSATTSFSLTFTLFYAWPLRSPSLTTMEAFRVIAAQQQNTLSRRVSLGFPSEPSSSPTWVFLLRRFSFSFGYWGSFCHYLEPYGK